MVIYRDMIAPLRTKLVRSEALLERQEKLATKDTLAAGIADSAVISGEISRLERIVKDVLHFARPSEPELSVVRADIPLSEVQSLVAISLENDGV